MMKDEIVEPGAAGARTDAAKFNYDLKAIVADAASGRRTRPRGCLLRFETKEDCLSRA